MKLVIRLLFFPYKIWKKIFKYFLLKYYKYKGAEIGKDTYLGPNVFLDVNHKPGKIIIGENCFITRNCILLAHTDALMGGPNAIWLEKGGERICGDVVIGDNVFVGVNTVILPNVKIGKNAVIGASSLINKDVPEGAIVAGVPGKIIGSIYDKINTSK